MKLQSFLFSNSKTKQTVTVQAIDGHSAWLALRESAGTKTWNGTKTLGWPCFWEIAIVCPCGKTGNTTFCSEDCFEKAQFAPVTS